MDASVIKGFLVSIGFKLDRSGLASMQDAVAKAGKVAGNVSGLFDNLGKSFRAAAAAAKQVGQAAAGVRPSITALSETGRRLAAALKSIGESARFAAAALRSLVRIVAGVVAVFAAAAVGVGRPLAARLLRVELRHRPRPSDHLMQVRHRAGRSRPCALSWSAHQPWRHCPRPRLRP